MHAFHDGITQMVVVVAYSTPPTPSPCLLVPTLLVLPHGSTSQVSTCLPESYTIVSALHFPDS